MDKNRIIVYVTLIILFCSLLFASLSTAECVILIIAAFLIIGVTERAYYYFIRANRIYSREDRSRYPEAMKYYKKTLAAGISPKYTVLTATILIQEGEKAAGQAALEKLIAKKGFKDQVLLSQAKCALSLAFYVDKDYERALSLCEEVLETDYRDNVLYINTCTYYLALNRTKDFKKLVEDFSRTRVTSLALLDLQVVYQMLRGEWDSAYRMLSSLFEKAESFLTETEKAGIKESGRTITQIMAVRFLTDYLAGDVYYNIAYSDHNLVRTRTQLALMKSMDAQWDAF